MDVEAIQLLNLSPIPELSEIELSTMMDHLSGLSDINGDLTDRNVEDIIKEAEDLLDRSMSSQVNEMREVEKSPKKELDVIGEDSNFLEENEDCKSKESNLNIDKPSTNSVHNLTITHNSPNQNDCNKHFNSPVDSPQSKVYSPVGPINHIKSTIDSLKEFTSLVEKKLSSQSENLSPKSKNENKAITKADKKVISKKNELDSPKIDQSPRLSIKESKSLSKSIKLLNCFERLYQVRPVRFAANKKPKMIERTPKTAVKKKAIRDVKTFKKSNHQVKSVPEKIAADIEMQKTWCRSPQTEQEDLFLKGDTSLKCFQTHDFLEMKPTEDKTEDDILAYKCSDQILKVDIDLRKNQSRIDENLIIKALEEVEVIKNHVRKGNTGNEPENAGGSFIKMNDQKEENVIQRLEAQFAALKEKYDFQMEKLEAENLRLREALINREKFSPQEDEVPVPIETRTRSASLESCEDLKNSLTPEKVQILKEAFSQTEENKDVGENVKKTENKENVVGLKKKPGKCKPFADINARQKKTIEHETQLLATLRGLQAEATAKDKENRKLKSELESLKKQLKKATGVRVENCKRCNVGTQTIGLGPIVQKPYNPENYEVPDELEKENEDLRTRVKALEEDFELLKEKRISDLQALHQVHEEEMAKLVSKLETQSALTRHLHSLLVNR